MHKLYDAICEELKALEKKADNGLSMSDIQLMDTLLHAKKNLLKSEEMEEESEYSGAMRDGMMYRDGMRGGSYRGSYARGRGRNARRDSMGRYSSEGYSRAAEDMADRMRSLAQDAPDDRTRREIEQMADRMQTM